MQVYNIFYHIHLPSSSPRTATITFTPYLHGISISFPIFKFLCNLLNPIMLLTGMLTQWLHRVYVLCR